MKHPEGIQAQNWQEAGFGLYIHWPFCAAKCPYCDFNSHVSASVDQTAWRDAYVSEIGRLGALSSGRMLDSIFFGGGTPSLMAPDTVGRIIEAARKAWSFRNTIEVTLEANPTSVEIGKFRGFADAGINRVSLGLQSLDDQSLRLLGRKHTVDEGQRAWDVANAVFERTSFDLIYARQHQKLDTWRKELSDALSMAPKHLSLYQLTIEDGTAFGDRYRIGKLPGLPSEDTGADMYDLTQDLCSNHGLIGYEISNHARSGFESVHNKIYWRSGDYVGVGPGAHGRLTFDEIRRSYEHQKAPSKWLYSASRSAIEHEEVQTLTIPERVTEYLLMGLRLTEGVSLDRLYRLQGRHFDLDALTPLIDLGLIWQSSGSFGTTQKGRPLLNAILREILKAY